MLVLVSYDIATTTREGCRRLHNIAKLCENHGHRVQNSVFECRIDAATLALLKNKIRTLINSEEDSVRIYCLNRKEEQQITHFGRSQPLNLSTSPLIL